MEGRDDHAEPEFRQHRPRPAARPAHRHRAAGRVVAQPFRRLPVLGTAGRRRWRATARCTRSTGRPTARASRCRAISRSTKCVAAAEQALDRLGLDRARRLGGQRVGRPRRHSPRDGTPRLRTLTTIGTPVQGFTLGEKLTKAWPLVDDVPVHRADRVHREAAVRLAARHAMPLPLNPIRRRRSWRHSATPTATACCTRCGR